MGVRLPPPSPLLFSPFRTGVAADAQAWQELTSPTRLKPEQQCIWEAVDEEEHQHPAASIIQRNGAVWLVRAGSDEHVVGCVALRVNQDGSADITKVRVSDAYDTLLVGTFLLQGVLNYARTAPSFHSRIRTVYISDHSSREGMVALYEANGFRTDPNVKRKATADVIFTYELEARDEAASQGTVTIRPMVRGCKSDYDAFRDISVEWITAFGWQVEPSDIAQLEAVEENLLNCGAAVFLAELPSGQIVGTCGLTYDEHHDCWEIAKVSTPASHQRCSQGRLPARACAQSL